MTWLTKSTLGGAAKSAAAYSLCVDPATARTRRRANQLARMGYAVEWCIKALDEVAKARRRAAAAAEADDPDDSDDEPGSDAGARPAPARPDILTEAVHWLLAHAPHVEHTST